jgi:non-ribosomal peptide synthetase component F
MLDPTIASTIDQLVRFRAAHDGAKPMVIDPMSRVSYRELDTTTKDLAAAFVEAGVGKGTRVGLIMPNSTRWVQVADRADAHRRGTGSVEHPAAGRRTRRATAGRLGAIPGQRRGIPRPPLLDDLQSVPQPNFPRYARFGLV